MWVDVGNDVIPCVAAEGEQGEGYSGGQVEEGSWFNSSEFFLSISHHFCGLGQDHGTILAPPLFFYFIDL